MTTESITLICSMKLYVLSSKVSENDLIFQSYSVPLNNVRLHRNNLLPIEFSDNSVFYYADKDTYWGQDRGRQNVARLLVAPEGPSNSHLGIRNKLSKGEYAGAFWRRKCCAEDMTEMNKIIKQNRTACAKTMRKLFTMQNIKYLFCLFSLIMVLNFWNLLPEQKMQTDKSGRFIEDQSNLWAAGSQQTSWRMGREDFSIQHSWVSDRSCLGKGKMHIICFQTAFYYCLGQRDRVDQVYSVSFVVGLSLVKREGPRGYFLPS